MDKFTKNKKPRSESLSENTDAAEGMENLDEGDFMFVSADRDFDPVANFLNHIEKNHKEAVSEVARKAESSADVTVQNGVESVGTKRRRKVTGHSADDTMKEVWFKADKGTRVLVMMFLVHAGRSVTRRELFRDMVHEYIRRHAPEIYTGAATVMK